MATDPGQAPLWRDDSQPAASPGRVAFLAGMLHAWVHGGGRISEAERARLAAIASDALARAHRGAT